ncbi:MAG: hypothetical protein PHW74_10550, partial [Desulfobacca sp.]|nr:hypothetical protein [Desulfobacca sp.]
MNARPDLTRWNRSRRSRFRYIEGNAATFLEELRQALIDRFSDSDAKELQWETLVPQRPGDSEDAYQRLEDEQARINQETERERLDRLSAQYAAERRDWGWEIARVLARSCHVLTEYLDAYANEGFLGTATQWDNVRRLVEMLDYHPAPPASASTMLVIEAKKDSAGTAAAGLQIKYSPPDGGKPVVFETLEDIEIDAELNQLRPSEYNRSQDYLGGTKLILEKEVADLTIGEPLLLEDEKTGFLRGYQINGFQIKDGATEIQVSPRLSQRLRPGYTKVHVKPQERLQPRGPAAKGAEVKRGLNLATAPAGLIPGMVLYISDGVEEYYRRLARVRGKRLVFNTDIGQLHLAEARVAQPVVLNVRQQIKRPVKQGQAVIYVFQSAGDWSYLANKQIANDIEDDQGKKHLPVYTVTAARYQPVEGEEVYKGYTILDVVHDTSKHNFPLINPQTLLVPPAVPGAWQVDTYLEKVSGHLPGTITASIPKKTSAGALAVVATGSQLAWSRLAAVSVDQDQGAASLVADQAWEDRGGGDYFLADTTIYAHFKEVLRLQGWETNTWPLLGNQIPLASVPPALKKGQTLLIENQDDASAAFLATVADIKKSGLVVSPNLPSGFTYGNTLIAGNVVRAGHGETKGEKVLGSGNATLVNQAFVLEEEGVSFIADATQPSGVRAAINVAVGGRTWQQVASFRDRSPTDPHFTVRMTENGHVKIIFGDAKRGRRLPTGG